MGTAESIAPFAGRSRNHRSSVSNGSKLFVLDGSDGRSATSRRFKDILDQIVADLGGADLLSEGQRQLARRAATLSIQAEAMEADAVGNKPFDTDLYGQLTDRLGRCLQRIGLKRVARDAGPTIEAVAASIKRGKPNTKAMQVPEAAHAEN